MDDTVLWLIYLFLITFTMDKIINTHRGDFPVENVTIVKSPEIIDLDEIELSLVEASIRMQINGLEEKLQLIQEEKAERSAIMKAAGKDDIYDLLHKVPNRRLISILLEITQAENKQTPDIINLINSIKKKIIDSI